MGGERRRASMALLRLFERLFGAGNRVVRIVVAHAAHQKRQWIGNGDDFMIAKRLDGTYLPGKREMVKVKHHRDADCVAIGYRIVADQFNAARSSA